jgi:hypothetical protein
VTITRESNRFRRRDTGEPKVRRYNQEESARKNIQLGMNRLPVADANKQKYI